MKITDLTYCLFCNNELLLNFHDNYFYCEVCIMNHIHLTMIYCDKSDWVITKKLNDKLYSIFNWNSKYGIETFDLFKKSKINKKYVFLSKEQIDLDIENIDDFLIRISKLALLI